MALILLSKVIFLFRHARGELFLYGCVVGRIHLEYPTSTLG